MRLHDMAYMHNYWVGEGFETYSSEITSYRWAPGDLGSREGLCREIARRLGLSRIQVHPALSPVLILRLSIGQIGLHKTTEFGRPENLEPFGLTEEAGSGGS